MRSANHAHITTRRTLLARAGAASVIGVTAAASASASLPHLDADLLRLGQELEQAWARERTAYAEMKGISSHEADEYTDSFTTVSGDIVDRIRTIPAKTFDGVLVKVRAIQWCRDGDMIEADECAGRSTDLRIAASIANDLMLMRGTVA